MSGSFFYVMGFLVIDFILSCLFLPLKASSAVNKEYVSPIYAVLSTVILTELDSGIFPIDCIYVINLEERPERWMRTAQFFKKYNISLNRVNAIDGRQISKELHDLLAFPYPRRLRGGQLGCLLSHLSVLNDAIQREYDLIWVLEDDVEILDDPRQIPKLVVDLFSIDPDWDILYTDVDFRDTTNGYIRSVDMDIRPCQKAESREFYAERIPVSDDIMQIRSRFGTYSMIISKKGAVKIFEYFTARPLWTAIDIDIHYIPEIREYSLRRDLVSNIRGSPSDTFYDSIDE